ncbi:hypothetical protein EH31_00760 [Erythrobacter longus]|uniref:Transferrin-binding protein B C-lobe/N-lobe beta barrel domain-containing protein n=1 Tax=Erythrobacter longus TaxID=1044 RepID=A0A074M8W5_ERYLO|nr:hypothetical protein [Erythrobacter longus]KEO91226.1 hypothetical protein EH31_00760 [Erythrobacter longus]
METGNILANGNPELESVVEVEEDGGPRSSDGIGFSAGFFYDPALGQGSFTDLANNVSLFEGGATNLERQSSFLRWILPAGGMRPKAQTLTWSMANAFGGLQPEFYSVVMLDWPDTNEVRRTWMFLGGSPTLGDDLPQSGQEEQTARIMMESDEPGDGSYLLFADGPLTIDYSAGKITGRFVMQPANNSLATTTVVDIDADFNLEFVALSTPVGQILGDVNSTSGQGRIVGAFFGPYGREIAMSFSFETSNGQSFYGDLEARRQ